MQRSGIIGSCQAAIDLDQLNQPVRKAAGVVIDVGTQTPGWEVGEFQVGMGIDKARNYRTAGVFDNRRGVCPAQIRECAGCGHLAAPDQYGPSGDGWHIGINQPGSGMDGGIGHISPIGL